MEKKDLRGALFPNKRKEKETQADLTGDILVDGQEYWISGWKNTAKSGVEYISISLKKKDSLKNAVDNGWTGKTELDDEIPF